MPAFARLTRAPVQTTDDGEKALRRGVMRIQTLSDSSIRNPLARSATRKIHHVRIIVASAD